MANPGPTNRVRVEDALSYLDQVKTMFMDQPLIYTHFLDIMKDFKSQAIDTPGVIGRVTQLFRGQPALIVGFNTFLPAGFEVRIDGEGKITILEPNGNVITVENEPYPDENQTIEDEEEYEDEDEDMEEEGEEEPMEDIAEEYIEEEEREESPQDVNFVPLSPTHDAHVPSKSKEVVQKKAQPTDQLRKAVIENDISGRTYKIQRRLENDMRLILEQEMEMKKVRQTLVKEESCGSSHSAVDYVNKIKIRFSSAPVVYREFINILSLYLQRHSQAISDGGDCLKMGRVVMGSIGELFKYHTDLIDQFRFFLPNAAMLHMRHMERGTAGMTKEEVEMMKEIRRVGKIALITRRRMDIRDAIKAMDRDDIILFEKIRQVTTSGEFRIIMRHIDLYSGGISSRKDFIIGVSPILSKFPLIYNNLVAYLRNSTTMDKDLEQSRASLDIDYSSCKLNGLSYRALPENVTRPKCSGRTPLCYEVLNESWVSIPSWASEDSSVVSSKKTQFEEFVYRTEDERFEFDMVLETNRYAIGCLQEMQHKLSKMSNSELSKYQIGENWNVSSPAIFLRAIRRVYGELAGRMLDALKKEPKAAVETLLDSLREKEREWKENLQEFNKGWREQVEKHTIRSLDHQSAQIKMNDSKFLRPKNLINQIENLEEEGRSRAIPHSGPHFILRYDEDRRSIADATDLLIHHVRRSNLSKEEKKRVKHVLRKFVPEIMGMEEGTSSDSEDIHPPTTTSDSGSEAVTNKRGDNLPSRTKSRDAAPSTNSHTCRLVYSGNVFYVFLRIHNVLCERLSKLRRACEELWEEQKLNEHMKEYSSSWNDLQKGLHKLRGHPSHAPSFDHVIFLVKESLDGNIEPVNLEDEMRSMLPTHASMAFSIDKMVMSITRQLQIFSSPDADKAHTLQLYNKFREEKAPYSWQVNMRRSEDAYLEEANTLMEGHNCYKIIAYNRENPVITIELMEKDDSEEEKKPPVQKGRPPKKDKKNLRMGGVKKTTTRMPAGGSSRYFYKDICPSIPHGKEITIIPYRNPYGDSTAKRAGAQYKSPMNNEVLIQSPGRTKIYGRLKPNHNEVREERKERCGSWFT